eukprot:703426-Amphidinium_carterae.1
MRSRQLWVAYHFVSADRMMRRMPHYFYDAFTSCRGLRVVPLLLYHGQRLCCQLHLSWNRLASGTGTFGLTDQRPLAHWWHNVLRQMKSKRAVSTLIFLSLPHRNAEAVIGNGIWRNESALQVHYHSKQTQYTH